MRVYLTFSESNRIIRSAQVQFDDTVLPSYPVVTGLGKATIDLDGDTPGLPEGIDIDTFLRNFDRFKVNSATSPIRIESYLAADGRWIPPASIDNTFPLAVERANTVVGLAAL